MTHGRAAAGPARGGRALPPPVPARAGRRVPGHQPRPVRPGRRAVQAGAGRGRGTGGLPPARAVRGGRRRPVDLRLPRRHHPQHRRVRARLPERHHHPAGAELPLHPDHPRRGQRRHRPQPGPAAEEPVVRGRRRRARSRASSPRTSTTRPAGSAQKIDALTDAGEAKPSDVAVFYRTNAQSRVFEDIFIRLGLPYKVVGGVRFYERKEVRDVLAYLRVIANPIDLVSLRRILNTPRRGIGDRAELFVETYAERERIPFAEALMRADPITGPGPPLGQRDRRVSSSCSVSCARSRPARSTARPATSSRRCSPGPATSPSWRPATTRRTRAGSTTCASWSAWPPSSRSSGAAEADGDEPAPPTWTPSSSTSRWSPTPTRFRTPAVAWSP